MVMVHEQVSLAIGAYRTREVLPLLHRVVLVKG